MFPNNMSIYKQPILLVNVDPVLKDMVTDALCYFLSRFLCEIVRENVEDYPGQSLYELVMNTQMHIEQ